MKLISVNIEGLRHLDKIRALITREQPDVLCLQEAPKHFSHYLADKGYYVSLLPRKLKTQSGTPFVDCLMIATTTPHTSDHHYYFNETKELTHEKKFPNGRISSREGILVISLIETEFTVATTHFTWTSDGAVPSSSQKEDMARLLQFATSLSPHILCGDFNIPRLHNPLYHELTKHYSDVIPQKYTSSMDRDFHHLGKKPDKQIMFNEFMVDYLFTQPPYTATDVHLAFGVSDHAAVIANISKK